MNVRITVFCIALSAIAAALAASSDVRTIVILPFINSGSIEYDNLRDLIPTYFYTILKDLPGYEAVSHHKTKRYADGYIFKIKNWDRESLSQLARDYNAQFIIRGEFTEAGRDLIVHCVIQNTADWTEDSRLLKGAIKFPITYTLDELFLPVVKNLSEYIVNSSVVSVTTQETCRLTIDGEYFGETPLKMRLLTGEHRIAVTYPAGVIEEPIYDETLSIVRGTDRSLDINVHVPISVNADQECAVWIDGSAAGTTPFSKKVYTGREYAIEVIYTDPDGTRITAHEGTLSTREHTTARDPKIEIMLHRAPVLSISDCDYPLLCSIDRAEPVTLPVTLSMSETGKTAIDVFVYDPDWNRRWSIHKTLYAPYPFERILVDLEDFRFTKNYLTLAVPGLPQFHNRENEKGSFLLSTFGSGMVIAGIGAIAGFFLYEQYIDMRKEFDEYGTGSGYTRDDVDRAMRNVDTCKGTIAGGLILAIASYVMSIADGVVSMDRLDVLLNGENPR